MGGVTDQVRIEIQHVPASRALANRGAVMDFARIDRDDVARPCFDHPAPRKRFLCALKHEADAELFMAVSGKAVACPGHNGLDPGAVMRQDVKRFV